jgi:hypothetical protein
MKGLLYLVAVAVICAATWAQSPPAPTFPDSFTTFVNTYFSDRDNPIMYRLYIDPKENRARLDSWGIPLPERNKFADLGDLGPPLYYFLMFYSRHEIWSVVPGSHGLHCSITRLNDPFPASAPDLSTAQYNGTFSIDNTSCNVWQGNDLQFDPPGNYSFAADNSTGLPVCLDLQGQSRHYSSFNDTRPDDDVFDPHMPCRWVPTPLTNHHAKQAHRVLSLWLGYPSNDKSDMGFVPDWM